MQDADGAERTLLALKQLGVQLAIDDFGRAIRHLRT
jgi:EAL domain-containing protein (putative c-di-GMP-specific phosphodiesterase class I)